jgi:probable HAF family extracellular repeat protein
MRSNSIVLCSALLLIGTGRSLAATVITETIPPPPQYTVTDLGSLGWVSAIGTGINATGDVSGYVWNEIRVRVRGHRSVRWAGTIGAYNESLGGSGFDSQGWDINDAGQVAGGSRIPIPGDLDPTDNPYHAVRWTNGIPTDLGTLGGTFSSARAINASGQVAGNASTTGDAASPAVVWTGTTATALGTLGGGSTTAYDINDLGQVAGNSTFPFSAILHAVRWTGTTPTDLGIGTANGINNAGQVVGTLGTHATIWTGTTPTDLGTLGGSISEGLDINSFGVAVGMSFTTGDLSNQPFISIDGMMYNLNNLLVPSPNFFSLEAVTGINDRGQIVGYGLVGSERHAVRLNPVAVPEPASMGLIVETGALFLLRRRA